MVSSLLLFRYDHVKASGHAKPQSTSASTKPLSQPVQLPTDNPKLSKPVPLGKKKAAGGDAVSHPPRSGSEPKVKNNVRADWANAEEFVPGTPYSAHGMYKLSPCTSFTFIL